jgi:hypothetical protein
MNEPQTRSVEGALYNEVVDAWMIPQKDPYTLENFQKAYDNLAARQSSPTLDKAQAAEFAPAKKLKPTHYALKIYPRTEEEQWRVETMEDVQVAYMPFCFARLTREEAAKVAKTKSPARTFAEKSPYTVTHDYTDVTDGGPTGPVTYQLPILYTVWPADKPLPTELEYVVDYEVFLPQSSSLSKEARSILGGEAVALARGGKTRAGAAPAASQQAVFRVNIYTYDSTLGRNVPMPYLRMRFQDGSLIVGGATNANGEFEVVINDMLSGGGTGAIGMQWHFIYGDSSTAFPRWKITTENSTDPYSFSQMIQFQPETTPFNYRAADIILAPSNRRENEIHRAVYYFYNGQTVFPKSVATGGVRIIADGNYGRPFVSMGRIHNDNGNLSEFYCVIHMYDRGPDSQVIGDTLHEIGHMFHSMNDRVYNPVGVHKFLQESFACYVGWYLGEEYYKSKGWIKPGADSDITMNGQQSWTKTYSTSGSINEGWYSPLFVDLTDDYNQLANNRPDDTIQNVPPSVVWNIVSQSRTWNDCKLKLQEYIGTGTGKYYTLTQYSNWITSYDEWVGW